MELRNAATGLENKFSETTLGIALVLATPVILIVYWFFMRKVDIQMKKKFRQEKTDQIVIHRSKTEAKKRAEMEINTVKKVDFDNEMLQNKTFPVSNTYTFKKSLFEKERTYELAEDGLTISEDGQMIRFIPFADVRSVRLYYKPGRYNNFNYVCEIDYKGGAHLISSSHYVSLGNFENRNRFYSPFIQTFIKKINQKNPSAQLVAGHSQIRYFLYLLISIGSIFLIGFSLFLFPIVMGGFLLILRILFIVYLGYYTLIMMKKNVPKKIVRGIIPEKAIPKTE